MNLLVLSDLLAFFLWIFSDPIKKNCVFSFDSFDCDLYVINILIKVNKVNPLGDLSFIDPFPLIYEYSD